MGDKKKTSWPVTVLVTIAVLVSAGAHAGAAYAQQSPLQPRLQQNTTKAVLSASAYNPWPGGAAIALDLMDNSDRNLALLTALKGALKAHGYPIDAQGPVILSLDSREDSGAWSDAGERTFLELRAKGGREGRDASARVNIFDSARGGLINEGQLSPQRITPTRIIYELTAQSRSDGKRLWQARASVTPQAARMALANEAIAGEFIKSLGKTIHRRAFTTR